MMSFNSKMLVGDENRLVVGIEDVIDPDGRIYRLEYRSTPDAKHAIAFCLSNPWDRSKPNAGQNYTKAHVATDGLICTGGEVHRTVPRSPYRLDWTIERARFWCIAFSAFMETNDPDVFKV